MTLVLGTVAEKVAVQLLEMIFCDRDVGKGTSSFPKAPLPATERGFLLARVTPPPRG